MNYHKALLVHNFDPQTLSACGYGTQNVIEGVLESGCLIGLVGSSGTGKASFD